MTELSVVSTFFPLPVDRGDPVRVMTILRSIARVRGYTLYVVRRDDTTPELEQQLRALLPNVAVKVFDPTPYTLNRLGALGRFPEALTEGMPPWIRSRYSRQLHSELQQRSGAGLAIGEAAAAYFPGTDLMWHWDKANVLAASTRQDVDEAESVAHRMRAGYLAQISTRFEGSALRVADTVSVTNDLESDRLHDHYGRRADFCLPSCVELPALPVRRPEDRHLFWLSSFSFRPNLLGLRRFLEAGWEVLRAEGFRLTLIGSGLTESVRRSLETHQGVEAVGYVEDLGDWLARAHAGVVPLWSGAGVKLKSLTMLSYSVPLFSTPIGAEGIPAGDALRIAEDPLELAHSICATDRAELERMAVQGRKLIAGQFSEEGFASRLLDGLSKAGVKI